VGEQDAEVGVGRDGRHHEAPVHVRVSPGFPHEGGADRVVPCTGVAASRQDRISLQAGESVQDDPERLAGGVRVHGQDAPESGPR
jgi:hypothetical protein